MANKHAHPDDPMGPVSDAAAFLFAEFDRLHVLQSEFFTHDQHFVTDRKLAPDPEMKRRFEGALEASRQLGERAPESDNSLFAAVLCSSMLRMVPSPVGTIPKTLSKWDSPD